MSQSEKKVCYFTLDGTQFLGELLLEGEHSHLTLSSRNEVPYSPEPHSLYGESLDHKKISLHDCVGEPSSPEGIYPNFIFKRQSFPHYAVIGNRHVTKSEKIFSAVSFQTDDFGLIFSPRDTFGSVSPPPLEFKGILENSYPSRKVDVGKNPAIFFFSGVPEHAPVDVGIGRFSVDFDFRANVSGHAGIQCSSVVTAVLEFDKLKSLDELLDDVIALSLFFTVAAGRYQGVNNISATIGSVDSSKVTGEKVSVHWSYAPLSSALEASNLKDVPITPEENRIEFYTVFQRWMSRHRDWLPARLRVINWQKNGRTYDENRLVAAANAFDILPDSTYPDVGELSKSAKEAKEKCKKIIRELDDGPEKNHISGTLAFWGGRSLKLKILSRSSVVRDVLGEEFPDIDVVLTTAVLTRNYFVHGTNKFGYENYENLLSFFTDTLEFVFVASDLIDCGWDAKRWAACRPGSSHPLADFYRSYKHQMPEFNLAKANAEKRG